MVRDLKKDRSRGERAEKHGLIYRFDHSLNQGIIPLKRMGANVAWNDRQDRSDLIAGYS